MAAGGVQRREGDGKILAEIVSIGSGDEWVGKQRWSGTAVGGAVGSVGGEDSEGEGFDGGVIHSEAGAKTGLAGTAEELAEKAVSRCIGRIGEADARREFVARRRQGAPHSGIGGIQDSDGAPGKTTDCLPGSVVEI